MQRQWIQVFLLVLIVILASCAPSYYRQGQSLLDAGNYQAAIQKFYEAEVQNPQDELAKRGLGITYFRLTDYERAIQKLSEAQRIEPEDAVTILYLGMSFEQMEEYDTALRQYYKYTELSPFGKTRNEIKARIANLTRKKIAIEARRAIEQEMDINPATFPPNSIGVLYFQNRNNNEKFDYLIKGLVEIMNIDLVQVQELQVVERLKLQKLLDELALGKSEMFDQSTVPRCGKLLGASKLVMGDFFISNDTEVSINALPVVTQTGELYGNGASARGRLTSILELEKNLVFQLVQSLGITLSDKEREAIAKTSTKSFDAFNAFCKGVDYEDKGYMDRAMEEYKQAFTFDPDFNLAEERYNDVGLRETSGMIDIPSLDQVITEDLIDNQIADDLNDRLGASGEKVGSDVLPDDTEDVTNRRPEQTKVSEGTLVIQGTVPE